MNKHLLSGLTLLFVALFSFQAAAQNTDDIDFFREGWWTFGVNSGAAWQKSDICALPGWGAGFTLGKNVYHRPGGLLDFDVRGRALYTRTFGADHFRSYGIKYNSALNGGYDSQNNFLGRTTPDLTLAGNGPGYTFQNHRTETGELSLEAVLTANRLRENTGIILQGFAGIGIDAYSTKTDQLDLAGNAYDWSEIDTTGGRFGILDNLGRDRDYETFADKYENEVNLSVMPSLGLALGYQVTPSFSVGIEHRTTWALNDHLDGQRFDQYNDVLSDNNDCYNYTSLHLRWRIGRRGYDKYQAPVTQNPTAPGVSYPTTTTGNAPIINFTSPNKNPAIIYNANTVNVLANIKHVERNRDVSATFNGRSFDNFSFDPRTKKFGTVLTLEPGNNEITITATNKYGQDTESKVIVYKPNTTAGNPTNPPMGKAPEVNIAEPQADPYNSVQDEVTVKAAVSNVSGKQDVTVRINNRQTNNFSMGYLNNTVVILVPLQEERTTVKISASNAYGNDSDTQTIVYCPPGGYTGGGNTGGNTGINARPDVNITRPSNSPYNSANTSETVSAIVTNVAGKNNIRFEVNNKQTNDFNYNTNTNTLTANVALGAGTTNVKITATNNYGSDRDDVSIVYCPPYESRPQVTITKPMSDPFTTNSATETVVASVTNVTSQSGIQVLINNKQNNFGFNSNTGVVTVNANLNNGNNTIEITATNNAGSDSDDVVIIYEAETIEKPTVKITKPGTNPYTSPDQDASIIATVTNVDGKQDIKFKVNGKLVNDFSYIPTLSRFVAGIDLETGNNTVVITATNEAGSASDDVVIKYNRPTIGGGVKPGGTINPVVTGNPPTVNIVTPSSNPFTTESATETITGKVTNVTNKTQVKVFVNNKENNFGFAANTGIVTVNANLDSGNNTVVIKATNNSGTDSDNTTIKYHAVAKPEVNITKPTANPYTASSSTTGIVASILNIENKQDITFKVNGQLVNNFSFSTYTNKFSSEITLKDGNNTVVISASNSAGSDSDNVTIKYNKPTLGGNSNSGAVLNPTVVKKKPTVKITKPGTNPYTSSDDKAAIIANITDVNSKSNIKFKLNGQTISNFDYVPQINRFSAQVDLRNGNNTFVITATNSAGSASDQVLIKYNNEQSSNIGSIFGRPGSNTSGSGGKTNTGKTDTKPSSGKTGGLGKGGSKTSTNKTDNKTSTSGKTSGLGKGGKTSAKSSSGKPVVTVLKPVKLKDRTLRTATTEIEARIAGVAGKDNILLVVNGKQAPFSFSTKTGKLEAVVNLKKGPNKIEIKAKTKRGEVKETINVMRL